MPALELNYPLSRVRGIIGRRKKAFMEKDFFLAAPIILVLLQRVSLVRPAPAELPQDRKVARVGGRSGAISYLPIFYFPRAIHS